MFDMGFTEMMLIGIVALVVIGPEKLPGVARTAGKYFGRLRRFVMNVKADVESELRADELREILAQQQQELNSLKESVGDAGRQINAATASVVTEVKADSSPEPDAHVESTPDPAWAETLQSPADHDQNGVATDSPAEDPPINPQGSRGDSRS